MGSGLVVYKIVVSFCLTKIGLGTRVGGVGEPGLLRMKRM